MKVTFYRPVDALWVPHSLKGRKLSIFQDGLEVARLGPGERASVELSVCAEGCHLVAGVEILHEDGSLEKNSWSAISAPYFLKPSEVENRLGVLPHFFMSAASISGLPAFSRKCFFIKKMNFKSGYIFNE